MRHVQQLAAWRQVRALLVGASLIERVPRDLKLKPVAAGAAEKPGRDSLCSVTSCSAASSFTTM